MDQDPSLSGILGSFAELGERGFRQCPGTAAQAAAVRAGHRASHPTTLAHEALKQQHTREVQNLCGEDAQCARAQTRRRAAAGVH